MNTKSTSRRAFLELLGRTTGYGAVARAMSAMGIGAGAAAATTAGAASSDSSGIPRITTGNAIHSGRSLYPVPADWPAGSGTGKEIVILGAGIAGMAAAWELRQLGYDCTLLEAQATAGGRCLTIRSGDVVAELDSTQFCEFDDNPDLYFNPGPARIPHHHEFLLGYCREFKVALELFNNDNRAALLHSKSAFAGKPQPARRVLADTRGHIAELLASAVDQGALDQALGSVDRNRLRAMLQEFGDLTAGGNYSGSTRAGLASPDADDGANRNNPLNPLELTELLDSEFWQFQLDYSQSLDQQPTMLQPVGGMDHIARAFESRVGEHIEYGARVTAIRSTNAAVKISFLQAGESRQIAADYCICTLPATVLRAIDNNFSAAHRAAIGNFQYAQACKIAFQSSRFWERQQNIYGGISWTDQDITQLWYPNSGFGAGKGIVLGAYTFSDQAGRRFAGRSPQQRLTACKKQANKLHPQFGSTVRRGISVSWPNMPYQLGAWGLSDPGILRRPTRRVYFAGEHISDLQGWQEGAILSAYNAIDGIVQRDS